jgi:hypothetical protein
MALQGAPYIYDINRLRVKIETIVHPERSVTNYHSISRGGRDSSVGIATGYGLDGPGIESPRRGGGFFAHVQIGTGTHPVSCRIGTGSFPRVKLSGVVLTTHLF